MLLGRICPPLPLNVVSYCMQRAAASNKFELARQLEKCYAVLALPPNCERQLLKTRYLDLVKQFHPDTGGANADPEKFNAVREAYRFIVLNDYSKEDRDELEDLPPRFDIRHTAPQHRQYLEYGGVGAGTPSQRQRQWQQHRLRQASESVSEYVVEQIVSREGQHGELIHSDKEAAYARRWRTSKALDRLVEDYIQEAMRRGEFSNLPGAGKPLPYTARNPFVDSTTHKINEIMVQNGFSPEWVMLEKEIRQSIADIRRRIREKLNTYGSEEWRQFQNAVNEDIGLLNKKIDHFNLVCPGLSRQMVRMDMDKELKKLNVNAAAKNDGQSSSASPTTARSMPSSLTTVDSGQGLFNALLGAFWRHT